MKTFATIVGTAAAVSTEGLMTEQDFHFINYIAQHNKVYQTVEEFEFRQQVFVEMHAIIEAHNAEGHTWTLGHNQFSDWTHEEYKTLLGYKPELRTPQYQDLPATPYVQTNSSGVNWVTKGAVTPVKD